jgi:hypothetical protein
VATLDLLADAAAEQPLLVVAEDLQWLDPATVSVLRFIARRLEHDPVVLLATTRDEEPDPLQGVADQVLDLAPLDPEDSKRLLASGRPDGLLLHLRDTYPTETAWAPPWVGDELRQARACARDARLAALRADAEAAAAAERASATRRPGIRLWLPATGLWVTFIGHARPYSPGSWRTGQTGSGQTAGSGSWPWPPTPNYAAATPTSPGPRCAPPKLSPTPTPSTTTLEKAKASRS